MGLGQQHRAGIARGDDPNSAGSQVYVMLGPAPFLNGQYTVWGRVIDGMMAVDAIAKGDEVVTVGGMLGKVTKLNDNSLSLEVANGVEVQIQRNAVVQVLPKGTIKNI